MKETDDAGQKKQRLKNVKKKNSLKHFYFYRLNVFYTIQELNTDIRLFYINIILVQNL